MNMVREVITVLFGAALFVNALLFVPQVYKLIQKKDATGVSLITFLGFSILQLISVSYGFIKKDYVMIVGFGLSCLMCLTISFLILKYMKTASKNRPVK